MSCENNDMDKSTWAIGGCTLIGVGVGFFFLQQSVFAFIGCVLGGTGLGLVITSVITTLKRG